MNSSNPSQIVLALELSNPSVSSDAHAAALYRIKDSVAECVGSMPMPSGIRSSDGIMVLIESLCSECSVPPTVINRIVVSTGPGGYTALRISTTTAKVLAHTLGCELVGVETHRVAAQCVERSAFPALIALASKNQHAHCSLVTEDGSVGILGVIDSAQLESLSIRTLVSDAHLPKSFANYASEHAIEVQQIVLDARHVLAAAIGNDPVEPLNLEPIYAREPDAVTQWRERKKKEQP